jgi:signal peptidase I
VKRSYYDAQPPKYGAVLCFKRSFAPDEMQADNGFDEKSYRFARVAGLPGDEIEIRGDGAYRNGMKLSELIFMGAKETDGDNYDDVGGNMQSDVVQDEGLLPSGTTGGAFGIRKVGRGEVFVLNDDPLDALDSRDKRVNALLDEARGRIVFRVWPIDKFGVVD